MRKPRNTLALNAIQRHGGPMKGKPRDLTAKQAIEEQDEGTYQCDHRVALAIFERWTHGESVKRIAHALWEDDTVPSDRVVRMVAAAFLEGMEAERWAQEGTND